jgi:phage shock protein A
LKKKNLRAQYIVQTDDKREVRRAVESYMREYLSKANDLRDRVFTIQSELEFWEEEVKKMKEQFEEWHENINSFDIQLNTKIVILDIEKEGL